jgi:integrase
LTEESKNLTEVTRQETAQREGTQETIDFKGKIIEYVLWMQKKGYRESTIIGRSRLLKVLLKRGADLFDPETVKEVIAKQSWSEGRKDLAVEAYSSFLKMSGGKWDPPKYHRVETIPWVPTESEVDQLIAGTSCRVGNFLSTLKETAMRPGEAWKLKWIDLDMERKTISVTPEKNSRPRIFKLPNQLLERLDKMPKTSEHIFANGQLDHFRGNFCLQRKRIAQKLKNPRISRITFRTLRHWKASTEYHRTKDILHVMNVLGHKNIKNTLVYTHLINVQDDEYVSKVAWNLQEACQLLEAGFDYVTDMESAKIFRKRK